MEGDEEDSCPDSGDRHIGASPARSGVGMDWLAPPRRGTYVLRLIRDAWQRLTNDVVELHVWFAVGLWQAAVGDGCHCQGCGCCCCCCCRVVVVVVVVVWCCTCALLQLLLLLLLLLLCAVVA